MEKITLSHSPVIRFLIQLKELEVQESYGYDFWNAYEFSYLDYNKQPTLKVLEIKIPASSSFIIESKSLKLYLNSFYKKTFQVTLMYCKN